MRSLFRGSTNHVANCRECFILQVHVSVPHHKNQVQVVPVKGVRGLALARQVNRVVKHLVFLQPLQDSLIRHRVMPQLRGNVRLDFVALRGADAAKGVVPLEGARHRPLQEMLQPAFHSLRDKFRHHVRRCADQEFARIRLAKGMIQQADMVRLRRRLKLWKPIERLRRSRQKSA